MTKGGELLCDAAACFRWVALGIGGLSGAVTALAAGEEAHGDPWMSFTWKAVNFAVLVGLIYLVARKPVGKALRAAAARARDSLENSRERTRKMANQLEHQRQNLERLQAELERMRADTRAETEQEAERLKAEARITAERLKAQVNQQVEQARNQALAAIRADLADAAVKAADGIIREKMDDTTQKRLVGAHIERLEAGS